MSDCRFGVSPVNYPDPDPEVGIFKICPVEEASNVFLLVLTILNNCLHLLLQIKKHSSIADIRMAGGTVHYYPAISGLPESVPEQTPRDEWHV